MTRAAYPETREEPLTELHVLWGRQVVPPGEGTELTMGPLQLRFREEGGEIWVGAGPTPGDRDWGSPWLPTESGWTRWAVPPTGEDGASLFLTPALPDRLLVVKPEVPFRLAPGGRARVYVRVPVTVGVRLGHETGPLLGEFPTLLLSDTWWGDFLDGALGYWLPTSARREMTPELLEAHLVVCPLDLSNPSRDPLPVEKIALRVNHLSIFLAGNALWSDETVVRYLGDQEESHLETTGRPPEQARAARLVAPPRQPVERGLRARTFARLRALPGMGGS